MGPGPIGRDMGVNPLGRGRYMGGAPHQWLCPSKWRNGDWNCWELSHFLNHRIFRICINEYFGISFSGQECTEIVCVPGSTPSPTRGAYDAPLDPLVSWGRCKALPIPHLIRTLHLLPPILDRLTPLEGVECAPMDKLLWFCYRIVRPYCRL